MYVCKWPTQSALYQLIPESVGDLLEKYGDHSQDEMYPTHNMSLRSEKLKRALGKDLRGYLAAPSLGKKVEALLDQCNTAVHLCRFTDYVLDSRKGGDRGQPFLRAGVASDYVEKSAPPHVFQYVESKYCRMV